MLDIFTKSISKFFGTKSDRDLKEIQPILDQTLLEYPKLAALSNDELRGKTTEFKKRIADRSSKENGQITDIRKKIENDPEMDVETKEKLYEEIDELEKTIIKNNKEVLDEILPQAFSVIKETAKRLKENSVLEVTATQMDRDFAAQRDYSGEICQRNGNARRANFESGDERQRARSSDA